MKNGDLKQFITTEIKTLKDEFKAEIQKELKPIQQDIVQIKKELKPIQQDIVQIKKELKPIQQDIVQIRKDQNTIIKFFNEEYLDLRARVERIEQHLNLPTTTN